eukprot:gene10600-12334_t
MTNRGPDALNIESLLIKCTDANGKETVVDVLFMAAVLGMRGPLTPQPVHDALGNVLLWNGELFDGYSIDSHDNDTLFLLHLLSQASVDGGIEPVDFIKLMVRIKGPFAFIYWDAASRRLWFGRDVLGRRSLVINRTKDRFIVSSIGSFPEGIDDSKTMPQWNEVNTFGLYSIHIPSVLPADRALHLESHQWDHKTDLSNIGITTLDYDADNDQDDAPDTGSEVQEKSQVDQLHFYPFGRRTLMTPVEGDEWVEETFKAHRDGLFEVVNTSVHTRLSGLPPLVTDMPDLPRPTFPHTAPVTLPGRVGVLFSGGLDSMVLAAIAHSHIPADEPIHLFNVAFGESNFDVVPDRSTAISGLAELRVMAPTRTWILVKVNVDQAWMDWAKPIVYELSYPANTIMDMTISLALWFAARGEGIIHGEDPNIRVMSTCKVLLMGSGADEQLAGYGRHRSAFARGGWAVLQAELNKDFNRIWKRNLGRDDRVISSNRREPRFPYLDENVIEYLNSVPLSYVCDPRLPQGTGDKKILREVGKTLGLTESTKLIKKAIQFGSRSSKQLNKNVPARVTQKCGKEVFSFSQPLYTAESDPNYEKNQKTAQKMEKN